MKTRFLLLAICVAFGLATPWAVADDHEGGFRACRGLPTHDQLESALKAFAPNGGNGGLGFNMWATVVNRDGTVCQVARTGNSPGDQWPGSRVISAQKANTANAFSLPGFALSTANLYAAVQPGGSLFGLQESNPVDPRVAYRGEARKFGTDEDPMRGFRIGGVNVFGGGLALYDPQGELLGGLGVSGDTSCADHNIAWKVRFQLNRDNVPGGVAGGTDNIIYGTGGFMHPDCGFGEAAISANLPTDFPIGPNP